MSDLSIRELASADAAAVRALAQSVGGDAAARAATFAAELAVPGAQAWGVSEPSTGLVGVAVGRLLGHTGQVVLLHVAGPARHRGIGSQLLESVVSGLVDGGAAVLGADLPADEWDSAAFLARRGFRPAQVAWTLERPVPDAAQEEADAGPAATGALVHGAVDGLDVAVAALSRLSGGLDPDFDPGAWARVAAESLGARIVRVPSAGPGSPDGAAAVVLPGSHGETLECPIVLADEGSPFATLTRLVRALDDIARQDGCSAVRVPGATRWWDACHQLHAVGFRPVATWTRFTRLGFGEVTDSRRALLASWR